jgi:hypothetical protein
LRPFFWEAPAESPAIRFEDLVYSTLENHAGKQTYLPSVNSLASLLATYLTGTEFADALKVRRYVPTSAVRSHHPLVGRL